MWKHRAVRAAFWAIQRARLRTFNPTGTMLFVGVEAWDLAADVTDESEKSQEKGAPTLPGNARWAWTWVEA